MDLVELQRAFQQHVLEGDMQIAGHINSSELIPVAARLAIYSDAYRLRLADALGSNYPRLQQLLGAEAFSLVARQYLDRHPSQNTSVRWFGDQLPEFLCQHSMYASRPWLSELARWEWAVVTAFDSQDRVPLKESALAVIAPSQWPTLRFQSHPSVQILLTQTNAPALFKALAEGVAAPSPTELAAPQTWLIWRPEFTPRYRLLPADEAAALQCVLQQETFEAMCDVLCEWHDTTQAAMQAARLLKVWITDAMITAALAG